MSSNQASGYRQPTIRFENVIAYSPGLDITAAQPAQLTITIRMRESALQPLVDHNELNRIKIPKPFTTDGVIYYP